MGALANPVNISLAELEAATCDCLTVMRMAQKETFSAQKSWGVCERCRHASDPSLFRLVTGKTCKTAELVTSAFSTFRSLQKNIPNQTAAELETPTQGTESYHNEIC